MQRENKDSNREYNVTELGEQGESKRERERVTQQGRAERDKKEVKREQEC